jgi:large subunit ribosomal protein L6
MKNCLIKLFKITGEVDIKKNNWGYLISNKKGNSVELKSEGKFMLFTQKNYLYFKNISLSLNEIKSVLTYINNFNKGLKQNYFYQMFIEGVGYRFLSIDDQKLSLKVGFSNDVEYPLPEGVSGFLLSSNELFLYSYDYDLLKLTCSKIKKIRKPDVYKGKGVRYIDDVIRLKEIKK